MQRGDAVNPVLRYLLNWLILLDEAGATLLGFDPGETISSVAGKAQQKKRRWACVLCRVLDWIRHDHCAKSILPYVGSRALWPDAIEPLPGNNGD